MKSTDIADFLGLKHYGQCIDIIKLSTLNELTDKSLCFCKKNIENLTDIIKDKKVFLIVTEEFLGDLNCSYTRSKTPRLDYIKCIDRFFKPEEKYVIDVTAKVLSKCENIKVGAFTFIGNNVKIGNKTVIGNNVTIADNTVIGDNCIIKAGAVIGGSGFGYEFDENGIPHQFYHTGNVKIGNNVHIGSNTCIDKGTLGSTKINDNVKIDNLVHVAHNCLIEENTLVIAGAELSGGVHLGKNVWVGPNSCIREKLDIGNNALIGIGSVVVKNIESNNVYAGNPAKLLKTNN